MCGRYTLDTDSLEPQWLQTHFEIDGTDTPISRFNIAPTQRCLVVRRSGPHREIAELQWGLVPAWSQTAQAARPQINARSETAHQKPTFREAIRKRRCLIPATGFYEWKKIEGRANKVPYYIYPKDGGLFIFAGIWERWQRGNEKIESFAILTREANKELSEIHHRMPVILSTTVQNQWLDPSSSPAVAQSLLDQDFGSTIAWHPVSPLVNKPENDSPQCVTEDKNSSRGQQTSFLF